MANFLFCALQTKQDVRLLSAITHEDALYNREKIPLLACGDDSPKIRVGNANSLHALTIYCPKMTSVPGGAERIAALLANHLTQNNYAVSILTAGTRGENVFSLPAGVPVVTIDCKRIISTRKAIRHFSPDAFIVLGSGPDIANLEKAARWLNIPILLSERADPAFSHRVYWKSCPLARYFRPYLWATRTVVQFPAFKDFFPWYLRWKVSVLPNPVQQLDVSVVTGKEKEIVCVARINLEQKHQDLLVEAFALLVRDFPEWKVRLYGAEEQASALILRKLITARGLEGHVKLCGTTRNILPVLHKASIFAFPSVFEGFPNALAEALSSGLPAVALAGCPGTNQLIESGKTGFLVEDTPESFAEALRLLMQSPELRESMGNAAHNSMKHYAPEVILEQWKKEIDHLLTQRKNPFAKVGPVVRFFFPIFEHIVTYVKKYVAR
jgi:glycosyltransferase involved in cell wall biosynthesis